MKYKVGDVVWANSHGRVCVQEIVNDSLCRVIFLRRLSPDPPIIQSIIVSSFDIMDYFPICKVCSRTVPIENGMMQGHGEPLCYGSFMPQR
jgi:hypothetical protein